MGNSWGSANNVFVHTEQAGYFPGDDVRGTIYLNCVQPFKCDGLGLHIVGEERTHWVTTRSVTEGDGENRRTRQEREVHHGHNEFLCVNVDVYNFGGQVMPGQYQFPFTFRLPAGLPGVFRADTVNETRASITYTIHAKCRVSGMFSSNITHHQDLVVNQRLADNVRPMISENHQDVNCCCCFGRGKALVKIHVDKNAYLPGETAQIICEVDNNSTEAYNNVRVMLKRELTLHSTHGRRHHVVETVSENDYPGIPANTNMMGASARSLPLFLNPTVYPSAHGRIVDCKYFVEVTFVAAGCCISNLNVKASVLIYAPQPSLQAHQSCISHMPQGVNWAPQTFDSVQLAIPAPAVSALPPPYGTNVHQPMASAPPPMANYGTSSAPYPAAPTQYGQPQPQQAPYGQSQPQQAPYGQSQPQQAPYGQPQYAQQQQAPYGQPQYAQQYPPQQSDSMRAPLLGPQ